MDNGPPVMATSADGVSWQLISVHGSMMVESTVGYGYRIAATGIGSSAVDIAVPDVELFSMGGSSARSIDGGHTWTTLSEPFNTGIDVLPDGHTIYATGSP
jgi:hypothetical protein